MGTLTAVLQHKKTTPPTQGDSGRTFAQWLDALADGECNREELINGVHGEIDSDPDAGWELLALVDQYYRRHRIDAEDFHSVKLQVQTFLIGGVQTAEVTPPTSSPEDQPVKGTQPVKAAPSVKVAQPAAVKVAQPAALVQPAAQPAAMAAAHDTARPAPKRAIAVNDVLRNRYRVRGILGRGGMGTVYAATDQFRLNSEPGDQNVALKVLHTEVIQRPGLLAELRGEFQILQSLSHPNIVRVHEFDQDGDLTFFTMERLDGVSLARLIAEQKSVALYQPYALGMIQQIGAAVAYAHSRGVVHGDLNPSNIFVTDSGEIRVLDFGVSNRLSPFPAMPYIDGDSRTSVATPTFASCEVLEGNGPTASDDVYALACISYVILTGEHPFQCRNALVARKSRQEPRRPAGISYRQWRALKAGLSFDRKHRPDDVPAWLDKFPFPATTPAQLPPLPVLMAERPARRPVGPWLTCAVIALLAGVCWWAQDQYHFIGSLESIAAGGNTVSPKQTVLAPPVSNALRPTATNAAAAVAPSAVRQSSQSHVAPAKVPAQRAQRPTAAPASAAPAQAQIEMATSTVDVPALQEVASVPVHRRHNYRSGISFTWSTESGTAKAGQDFVPVVSRTEYMPAGDPEAHLLVPLVADPRRHTSKTFYVVIDEAADGATVGSRVLTMVTIPAAD
jgi:serine/threonine protein kinase